MSRLPRSASISLTRFTGFTSDRLLLKLWSCSAVGLVILRSSYRVLRCYHVESAFVPRLYYRWDATLGRADAKQV